MGFVSFFKPDQRSVLPALMEVARTYREKVEEGSSELKSPLRTLLLNCFMKELLQRVQKVSATEEADSAFKKPSG